MFPPFPAVRQASSSPKLINGDLCRLCVGVRAVFYRLWTRDDPFALWARVFATALSTVITLSSI
jgi:hypothetical protein